MMLSLKILYFPDHTLYLSLGHHPPRTMRLFYFQRPMERDLPDFLVFYALVFVCLFDFLDGLLLGL
eukprot:UN01663